MTTLYRPYALFPNELDEATLCVIIARREARTPERLASWATRDDPRLDHLHALALEACAELLTREELEAITAWLCERGHLIAFTCDHPSPMCALEESASGAPVMRLPFAMGIDLDPMGGGMHGGALIERRRFELATIEGVTFWAVENSQSLSEYDAWGYMEELPSPELVPTVALQDLDLAGAA